MDRLGWQEDGACTDPPEGANWTDPSASGRWDNREHQEARRICASCTVTNQCLEYALLKEMTVERRFRNGIWGGTTPEDRDRLTRLASSRDPLVLLAHQA